MGPVDVAALFLELYGRIPPLVRRAVDGVPAGRLVEPPAPGANTIAWLVWHLTRIQDHHIAELLEQDQVWVGGDWAQRFGLAPDPGNTGYGHSAAEALAVRPDRPETLLAYYDAVDARTRSLLEGITPDALDRIVDRRWDPPVTLGVRLVSVANDNLQHAGQAAFVRGIFGV